MGPQPGSGGFWGPERPLRGVMAPEGMEWGWDPPFQLWVQVLLWGLLLGRLLCYRGAGGGREKGDLPQGIAQVRGTPKGGGGGVRVNPN